MFDLLNTYNVSFVRNDAGQLFYVWGRGRGYLVTEEERLRLARAISPLYTVLMLLMVAGLSLHVVIDNGDDRVSMLLSAVAIGLAFVLASWAIKMFVRRSYLSGRPKLETGVRQMVLEPTSRKTVICLLLAVFGGMLMGYGILERSIAFMLVPGIGTVIGAFLLSWRRLPPLVPEE